MCVLTIVHGSRNGKCLFNQSSAKFNRSLRQKFETSHCSHRHRICVYFCYTLHLVPTGEEPLSLHATMELTVSITLSFSHPSSTSWRSLSRRLRHQSGVFVDSLSSDTHILCMRLWCWRFRRSGSASVRCGDFCDAEGGAVASVCLDGAVESFKSRALTTTFIGSPSLVH